MKRIWQKATAFLLAVMLIAAMCPMSLAANTSGETVYEYVPGSTSNKTTFTSVATNTNTKLTITLADDRSCMSITNLKYQRMETDDTIGANGHAPYNAFRLTGLAAGEYKISFKNAAQNEYTQQVSAAPAVYFFKANDDYTELGSNSVARYTYFLNCDVNRANDVLGYFNFAEAERDAYTTFKNDAGEDIVVKVTEPGDYYIMFAYVPKTLELAKYFRFYSTDPNDEPETKAQAAAKIAENDAQKANYWLELHIGGIKLEKLASEAAPTTLSYIVRAEDSTNNSKVTVSDTNYTVNGTSVGSWTVDTSFTATATGDDFAYWANGNGTPVSTEATYTFTPKSNFVLEAVYTSEDDTTKKVQFWNYNKVYIDEVTAAGETLSENMPDNPTLNGWTFAKWTTDGNDTFDANTALTDAITRVVAQFTKNDKPFIVDEAAYSYDDPFTKTAEAAPEGKVFSHWTINDQVASYEETLSFNVWNTVDVAAVYADAAPEAIPTVVLDEVNEDEYFIAYEVPAGYTPVDAGIVFSTTGTPSINSSDSKASVKQVGEKGQFTAAPGDDTHTVARGYVMYKDLADNYRIIYSAVK